jgi:N-methylhydantoinase B/oxoprolinase/acetone carboxylase alpha subunit
MSAFDEFEVLMKNVMLRHSSGGTGEMSGGAGEFRDIRPLGLSVVRPIFEPRISQIHIRSFTF